MENRTFRFFSHSFFDYLIIYLLIATSGMTFFYKNDENMIIGFLLSAIVFIGRRKKIDTFFYITLALFCIIDILQMTYFNYFNSKLLIGNICRMFFAYFAIRIANDKFFDSYVKIIYVTAIISMFFYLLTFNHQITSFIIRHITPIFKPLFPLPASARYGFSPNIIVYNYNYEHVALFRNVGPFWESGAFGVFLNIALMINMIRVKNIFNKMNLVFLISIITTFSTAAYISLFFFLLGYYLTRKDIKYKFIYILLALSVSIYGYYSFSFMQSKIQSNIANSNVTTKSRFGSARIDLKAFAYSPVLGVGRSMEGREMTNRNFGGSLHRNNGVTGLLSSYGFIIFIFYFTTYFYSLRNYVTQFYAFSNFYSITWVMLITVLLMGFSQRIFIFPFFYSLMFAHLIRYKIVPEGNTMLINN